MTTDNQSVQQIVSSMAKVLSKYLHPDEITILTTQWKQYPSISVKIIQQCVLEVTNDYPELKVYKSDIRKGFWNALQTSDKNTVGMIINEQKPVSEMVNTFYTVIEGIKNRLTAPNARNLFLVLHQTVSQERTFEGHNINIKQFLEGDRPAVPDNIYILNKIVQLTYVGLCDIAGPVEADNILFAVADTAKQSHPNAVVKTLF